MNKFILNVFKREFKFCEKILYLPVMLPKGSPSHVVLGLSENP